MSIEKVSYGRLWGALIPGACLALTLAVGWHRPLEAGEEAAQAVREVSVEVLIANLKSDDAEVREAARRGLVGQGESVRPALTQALDAAAKDPDFSTQLQQILKELRQDTLLARYDAPKKVNLELKGGTVQEALERLRQACGWEVQAGQEAGERKIDLAVKGARFFEALEALRGAAKLGYQFTQLGGGKEKKTVLPFTLAEPGEKGTVCACACGPFLVFVTTVNKNSSSTFDVLKGAGNDQSQASLQAYLIAEPGLPLSAVEILEGSVVDGQKNSLPCQNLYLNSFGLESSSQSPQIYHLQAQLGAQPAPPLILRATLRAQVPLKMGSKRIDEFAAVAGQAIKVGEATYTFQKPAQRDRGWELKYRTTGSQGAGEGMRRIRRGVAAFALARAQGVAAEAQAEEIPADQAGMFVFDTDGRALDAHGTSSSGNGRSMEVTQEFSREPKGVLFQWFAEKTEKKFSLELKDIPVP